MHQPDTHPLTKNNIVCQRTSHALRPYVIVEISSLVYLHFRKLQSSTTQRPHCSAMK